MACRLIEPSSGRLIAGYPPIFDHCRGTHSLHRRIDLPRPFGRIRTAVRRNYDRHCLGFDLAHDRMPVLLRPGDFDRWLAGNAGSELLKPAANDYLQTWPVSRRVNSSRAPGDDPTLIEQAA
ncbi:MAG: SOS response-associated peptidase family protein [Pseudolabrys sp.]